MTGPVQPKLWAPDIRPPTLADELDEGDLEEILDRRAADDPRGTCYPDYTPEGSRVVSGPLPGSAYDPKTKRGFKGTVRTKAEARAWAAATFTRVYHELQVPGRWAFRVSVAKKEGA